MSIKALMNDKTRSKLSRNFHIINFSSIHAKISAEMQYEMKSGFCQISVFYTELISLRKYFETHAFLQFRWVRNILFKVCVV